MPAHDNAYAAPQTIEWNAPSQASDPSRSRFPVQYLWQGIIRGFVAGLLASLSMILLYLVRMLSGYEADPRNLFLIAGAFLGVTITLGFVWGIVTACVTKLAPGTLPEWNEATCQRDAARGDS